MAAMGARAATRIFKGGGLKNKVSVGERRIGRMGGGKMSEGSLEVIGLENSGNLS
jgi:hypothetical protein